jgi:hypothetical protein
MSQPVDKINRLLGAARGGPFSWGIRLFERPDPDLLSKVVKIDGDAVLMKGTQLDLSSEPLNDPNSKAAGRRFVGIHFACCDIYTRVYVNRDETAYEGRCPRCARPVRLKIGPGGTSSRFFSAY